MKPVVLVRVITDDLHFYSHVTIAAKSVHRICIRDKMYDKIHTQKEKCYLSFAYVFVTLVQNKLTLS